MIRKRLSEKKDNSPEDLIQEWEKCARISREGSEVIVRMRDSPQGKQYIALGLTPFGGLRVKENNGSQEEKVLTAEYLW